MLLDVVVQCSAAFACVAVGLWASVNFLGEWRDYRRRGRGER